MHKVKIEGIDPKRARLYIDGHPISAKKIDVHMQVNEVHETEISMNCEPNMEYESLVTFDFSPKTVKSAVDVLKAALIKDDFVAFMGMNDLMKVMEKKK